MNRIYRLVWNRNRHVWMAVAENSRGRSKSGLSRKLLVRVLALVGSALLAPLAIAAPVGGQVSAGIGSIAQAGTNTTITQSSQNLAINWQGFSIAANEAVRFNQPNASAIALNRVLGQDPSRILGSLSANGQVFVLNSNGVLFGATAQVNVGGLVASTLNLSDADFMAGKHSFGNGGSAGAVLNQGTLTAANGGYIALLAPDVRNEGVISATLGTALLAAGDKVTLTLNNGSLLAYRIDQGSLKALAENKQLIQADGGQVFMSAKAANALSTAMVNNTGIIEARTVQEVAGVIKLMGDMQAGTVDVGGTLDASAPNGGNGGFVETSAAHVKVADATQINTTAPHGISGTWLIDPTDYFIGVDISAATLASNLSAGNITIQTIAAGAGNGDIFVNVPVTWSSSNKLTLNAYRDINFNASITNSAGGSLVLRSDMTGTGSGTINNNGASVNLSGGGRADLYYNPTSYVAPTNFASFLGATPYTAWMLVNDATNLQGMSTNLGGAYALGKDIDATATSTWNSGAGFAPIGNSSTPFTGTFDGLGHTINTLTINRPAASDVGLFGYAGTNSVIRNVGLVGGSVRGKYSTAGLVGRNYGSINNSYATGSVLGGDPIAFLGSRYVSSGGLVGYNAGSISNSYATGNVTDNRDARHIGGLVGSNTGSISSSYATGDVTGHPGSSQGVGGLAGSNDGGSGSISNSYATGNVSGYSGIGGLVGGSEVATISNSYAIGNVTGESYLGGLVGDVFETHISDSYATGSVTVISSSFNFGYGGLVGYAYGGNISNSYATGNVIGGDYTGGMVGMYEFATISNSYAIGNVIGTNYTGGLVGQIYDATISNSYTTGSVSGTSNVGGLVGGNTTTTVITSYATGNVSGDFGVGGLVGYNDGGTVSNSYAITGTVTGSNSVGGLVGDSYGGSISNSYSTRDVIGGQYVGGLVGYNSTTISTSYATGNVSGDFGVGGLVGLHEGSISNSYATGRVIGVGASESLGGLVGDNYGDISNSYATGSVSGANYVGGLIGDNSFGLTVDNSFWDSTVNAVGIGSDAYLGETTGATGKTTTQMMTKATFSDAVWDIANTGGNGATWRVYEGSTTPWLTWWLKPLTVGADSDSKTYNGAPYSGGNGVTYSFAPDGSLLYGSADFRGTSQGAINVGSYAITSGLYSVQQGYDISSVDGTLTINKAHLTVTANDKTRLYGAANPTLTSTVSGFVNGETASNAAGYSGAANIATLANATTNVGTALITGTTGNLAATNYDFAAANGTLTIDKAHLTVTADDKTRLYGAANPTLTSTVSGFVNGETANNAAGYSGAANITTLANATTNVGTALITGATGNLAATNYDFAAANGTLTINPAEIITPSVGGILPAVVDAIIALPGGADLLPAFSSTVSVAATQIDAVAPPPALANLQYVYVTTTPGNLSGDIDTTVDGKAAPTKAQGGKSDGFNERLPDVPIQFTGTVLVRNGGINLPSDADDSNERDKERGNK